MNKRDEEKIYVKSFIELMERMSGGRDDFLICKVDISHYTAHNSAFVEPLKKFPYFFVFKKDYTNKLNHTEKYMQVYSPLFNLGSRHRETYWNHTIRKELVAVYSKDRFKSMFLNQQLEFSF